ncbi:MAG: hypothetical protein NWE92_01895 [Candidatus Bathyarchaeota archaeon]|nr:hypothetical protein [Candidatus Bathyarchaeota archaeon]
MRLKLQFAVLFLFAVSMLSLHAACLDTWTPGVAAGDYFTYQMYGVFTSNRPNATLAIPEFEYNNTQWVRIDIASVEGVTVHQVYTLHFNNQSESTFTIASEVNPNGTSSKPVGQAVPICAADLSVGDFIPTTGLVINDTTFTVYADEKRETNHAEWNLSDDWGNGYFDKQTGMMVDFVRTHRFINNSTGEAVDKTDVIKLVDTNRWQVDASSQPTLLYSAIIVAVVALVVTFAALRRMSVAKKHANTRTQQGAAKIRDKYTLWSISG